MALELPAYVNPELSVVMVTHESWRLTKRAIESLVANTDRPFELIVVDNASEDETRPALSQLPGLRLILNQQNLGFGPGTNQAIAQARGTFLALLNSDAFVHKGWLEPLLDMCTRPGVEAAVPRYLNDDGTLQEAGALLALDGTVHLYGEGDDPERACYRFPRQIDYGSAVCLMIRRETFAALGGFDDRYAPAYYEDVDLCLRVAEHGGRVMYVPGSTVTHVRYGSGGAGAAAELSERNRGRFVARWSHALAGRPGTFIRAGDQAVVWARDVLAAPRFLICTGDQEDGAGELGAALLEDWPRARVTWVRERAAEPGDSDHWLALGIEVLEADEDPSWLTHRLFHYDVVVSGVAIGTNLRADLERTQPQAPWIALGRLAERRGSPGSQLTQALAGAGIAPPAQAPG